MVYSAMYWFSGWGDQNNRLTCCAYVVSDHQGLDFDDMSSFFPCKIGNAIQYINLGYGAQAPKNSYFIVHFFNIFFVFVFKF